MRKESVWVKANLKFKIVLFFLNLSYFCLSTNPFLVALFCDMHTWVFQFLGYSVTKETKKKH